MKFSMTEKEKGNLLIQVITL